MRNISIIIAMGAIWSASVALAAGNGSVKFNGRVVNQSCNATINGTGTPATVVLPSVQSSVLATDGDTAGTTAFTVNISDCSIADGMGSVKAFFESGPYVDVNGRLLNSTSASSGGAKNVVLQLIDNSGSANSEIIKIGDSAQASTNGKAYNNGYAVINSDKTAVRPYAVQYRATGQSTAGSVTSVVTYSLVYY